MVKFTKKYRKHYNVVSKSTITNTLTKVANTYTLFYLIYEK